MMKKPARLPRIEQARSRGASIAHDGDELEHLRAHAADVVHHGRELVARGRSARDRREHYGVALGLLAALRAEIERLAAAGRRRDGGA